MNNREDQIIMSSEDGKEVIFRVLEQTRLNGIDYLLVSTVEESEEEEEAFVLKDISEETQEEAIYRIVDSDRELEAVTTIFKELLDDIELY
jgi:uncharacterized protein YrzB (UPF0473 family)